MSIPAKYLRRKLGTRFGCDAWIPESAPKDQLIVDPGGTLFGHNCGEPARHYYKGEFGFIIDMWLCDLHMDEYLDRYKTRTEQKG